MGQVLPQGHESAGRKNPKGRGKGNPWLAGTLGNLVATAARTDSFLGARYRRIAKRRGQQKAIVAVGNSVLVIVYHLLADPAATFADLGGDHYQSPINHERRARSLASQLQAVTGQRIVIRDGKAVIDQPKAAEHTGPQPLGSSPTGVTAICPATSESSSQPTSRSPCRSAAAPR